MAALVLQPWRGPVVLAFSSNQGIDAGDAPSLLLLTVAVALISGLPAAAPLHRGLARFRRTWAGRPRLAAAACGTVLLLAGLAQAFDEGHQARLTAALAAVGATASLVWLLVAAGASALGPVGWFLVGTVVDVVATPSGTLFGPSLLAVALAMRRTGASRVALLATALAYLAVTVASLSDLWGVDVGMSRSYGGPARVAAIGVVLLLWAAPGSGACRTYSGTTVRSSKRAPDASVDTP